MAIELNITNSAPVFKKKNVAKSSSNSEDFSFKFEKKPTIKATAVVRRRVIPKSKIAQYATSKKPSEPVKLANVNNDDLNLFLNVTSEPVPLQEKKVKLTNRDRMKKKWEEKAQNGPPKPKDRPLTQKEITDGIKEFTAKSKPKVQEKRKHKPANLFIGTEKTEIVGQRFVRPIQEKVFTGAAIDSLDLHPHCVKNLSDLLSIKELTTVQQKAIPKALEGHDILVRSQTGSGKTLAYALPIVQKLQEIRPKLTRDIGIVALVIVPTRELALQTYELFVKLLKPFTWVVPGIITGGEKRKAEKNRLRKGINILIGTPGRLVDHLLHTEMFKLHKLQFLALDEADRLLDMGYERDVRQVVEAIQEHKTKENEEGPIQRLLLSATLTPGVQRLAGLALKDPLFIDNSEEEPQFGPSINDDYDKAIDQAMDQGNLVIPENLKLVYTLVPPKLRLVSLAGVLATEIGKKKMRALVFMSTIEMVNFHHDLMNEALTQKILDEEDEEEESDDESEEPLLKGVRFFKLHGSMTQTERSGVFKAFKESKCGVLLTTDVTGRGIDFPELDLVIQYSPPQKIADFVHRVGRTARAGKSGKAILFLGPSETPFVRKLEDKRIRITQETMESYLNPIKENDGEAHTVQEACSNLQYSFEQLMDDDRELMNKGKKGEVFYKITIKFNILFPQPMYPGSSSTRRSQKT
ncbi:DDX31 family protein [Megaselia abdita]